MNVSLDRSWASIGLDSDDPEAQTDNFRLNFGYQPLAAANLSELNDTDLRRSGDPDAPNLVHGIPRHLFDRRMLAFRRVVHILDMYGVPAVVGVGVVGNVLCFLVFMATYLRRMSSCIYLAALAVTDALFLVTTFCAWLDNVNVDIYHRPGLCQVLTYVGFVTSFLDVWYVVGFTVERYLAICFPFKRQTLCSPRRAKIVVVSLAASGAVLFNFALWSSEVGYHYERPFCAPMPRYYALISGLTNVDTLITLIIPTVIIITSNIRIAYAVAKFYRTRLRLESRRAGVRPPAGHDDGATSRALYSNSSYNRLQMKVTKMLLIVSTVFLLCHIPSHGFRVYVFIMTLSVKDYHPSHMALLVQKLFQYVYYTNFSLNFFLYNLSGKSFRKAMLRLCRVLWIRVANSLRLQYANLRYRRTAAPCDVIIAEIPERAPNKQLYNCIHHTNAYESCKVCEKYS